MKIQITIAILSVVALSGCDVRKFATDPAVNVTEVAALRKALGGGAAAVGPSTAETATPVGWATVQGKITLTAAVATTTKGVDKDPQVCGTMAPVEDVVTGPGNGLKNVVVFLANKIPSEETPWVHPSYAATKDTVVDFDQKKCIFLSHVLAMRTSQPLKILNSDPIGHNTSINFLSYNSIIPSGSSDQIVPAKAMSEPSPVTCSIHPWMQAFLFTSKHPYFAVTDENGAFKLENVPAGIDLEIRVWQEKSKFISGDVKVNDAAQKWSKGRMPKMNLADGDSKDLNIVLDVAMFQ